MNESQGTRSLSHLVVVLTQNVLKTNPDKARKLSTIMLLLHIYHGLHTHKMHAGSVTGLFIKQIGLVIMLRRQAVLVENSGMHTFKDGSC